MGVEFYERFISISKINYMQDFSLSSHASASYRTLKYIHESLKIILENDSLRLMPLQHLTLNVAGYRRKSFRCWLYLIKEPTRTAKSEFPLSPLLIHSFSFSMDSLLLEKKLIDLISCPHYSC